MDPFQGITVQILSNNESLELYHDPDTTELEESHSCHRYVEAVAGSTFQVEVNLTPQFSFYTMKAEHAVSVQVKIDGSYDS